MNLPLFSMEHSCIVRDTIVKQAVGFMKYSCVMNLKQIIKENNVNEKLITLAFFSSFLTRFSIESEFSVPTVSFSHLP